MNINFELKEELVSKIEKTVLEKLEPAVEQILTENIDDILREIVCKQLKSCALIYIQSQEFRQKMMDKVRPEIDAMLHR